MRTGRTGGGAGDGLELVRRAHAGEHERQRPRRERLDDRAADAAVGAGDERGPAGQVHATRVRAGRQRPRDRAAMLARINRDHATSLDRARAVTAAGLAYERRGAGPALVLLHPLGADRHVWSPVLDRVAAERDVIALDLPGFGRSPALNGAGPPTPRALAQAVAGFLGGLDLDWPPHAAGNSLGGWVALELGLAGAARSVCAIAPAGLWPEPLAPQPRARAARCARGAARLAGARAQRARPPDRARRLDRRPRARRARRRAPARARLRRVRPASRPSTPRCAPGASTDLERVRVPVTLAWPEHDRLVARPRRLPANVRSVALPGAGHLPMWDAPDAVASLLIERSRD